MGIFGDLFKIVNDVTDIIVEPVKIVAKGAKDIVKDIKKDIIGK